MKNLFPTLKLSHESEVITPQLEPKTNTETSQGDVLIRKLSISSSIKPKRKFGIFKRILLVIILMIIVTGGISIIWGVLPAKKAYDEGNKLITVGKELSDSLKNQDLEQAKQKLPEVRSQLERTQTAWSGVYLLKFVPYLNLYHQDVAHGLNAALYGLEALDTSISAIEPYADLLGLKAGSSFVSGSADERLQLAVKTMDKVTPKIKDIAASIVKLQEEISLVDPKRYPEKIKGISVRPRIIDGKQLIDDSANLFLSAQPLLEILPQLLGEPASKKYLVIFQNDKELRPTGGFMTAYAIFKIEQGKFIVEKSEDIYELDNRIKTKRPAPLEILTYHKEVYSLYIRDSNLSPDFRMSMATFQEMYPDKFDFDGIIAVDTHVLVEAIKILGSFNISGREFSAEIDKRCECPKVIYELEDYATRPVAYVRDTRKDIIGQLLYEIMKKALGVSPSQYWGNLFQMGLREINEKHILAWMKDEKAQQGIESLNMGGRIAGENIILEYKDNQGWDYIHINDSNMAGAKSNLFVHHFVTQNYEVVGDGEIVKTVTLQYKNPYPHSDCGLESGGLCLNALLRNWFRVYVPKGSVLIESKGSQSPKDGKSEVVKVKEELGKTVLEGFTEVKPLGKAEVVIKYRLPMRKTGELKSLIQKQPGTDGHQYHIEVMGKEIAKFNLTTDKVITVPL